MAHDLEELTEDSCVSSKDLLKLAEDLIDNLRIYNKGKLDELWLNLIVCILKKHGGQKHIDLALELSDSNNNLST